jgi:TolB-like protein
MKHKLIVFFLLLMVNCQVYCETKKIPTVDSRLSGLIDSVFKRANIPDKSTVLVLPFSSISSSDVKIGTGVAEYVIGVISSQGNYQLIERMAFSAIVEELELSMSDLVNEEQAVKIGKMLTAHYIVTGSVMDSFGKKMVSARLIEISTGKVLGSANVSISLSNLELFAREILAERDQISAPIFRSTLIPGWGQYYAGKPIRGSISLACFVVSAGYLAYTLMKVAGKKDDFNKFERAIKSNAGVNALKDEFVTDGGDGTDANAFLEYRRQKRAVLLKNYEDQKSMAWVAGGVLGAVWALNIIDASIAGIQSKRKVRLYFSGAPRQPVQVRVAVNFK